MTILSTGYVGVGTGTTSPLAPLHVKESSGGNAAILVESTNNAAAINLRPNSSPIGQQREWQLSANPNGSIFTIYDVWNAKTPFTIEGGTNSNNALYINSSANVGVGTATPTSKLEVVGQSRTTASTGGAKINAAAAINWDNGNAQSMSVDCATTTFTNMLDAGTYILAVTETGTSQCTFSQAGLTFFFYPANAARTSGQRTVYTFQRIGTDVYVSWVAGFQ
jgi:hypothetical protein